MQFHNQLSPKQGSLLFKSTGRKFWEPVNNPPPTVKEASEIIELVMKTLQEGKEECREQAVQLILRWFPDFEGFEIRWRFFGKKTEEHPQPPAAQPKARRGRRGYRKEQPQQQPPAAPQQEAKKEEPKEQPKQSQPKEEGQDQSESLDYLLKLVQAGIRNIWLHGPAGTGKTTICKILGERLGLPVTVESCGPGTSPGVFKGFRFPKPSCTPITEALPMPGIIVLDEFTMLQPDAAAEGNAMLANGEINTVVGLRVRHADCVIIATANTVGQGADRQYVGNNQLDAATLDRFACGFVEVGYSKEWELANNDREVCEFVWQLREKVKAHNIRRIVSTRSIQAASKLKAAGLNWKAAITATWTVDERRVVA